MKSVHISRFASRNLLLIVVLIVALGFVACQPTQKALTIVWAEWDPANYLQELSKGL